MLRGTKITKIFIPEIFFYGNIYFSNVCVGVCKMVFNHNVTFKNYSSYEEVGILGDIEKCINFRVCFLKAFKI